MNGSPNKAYESLCQARSIGEETGDQKVVGYACTWLTWACVDTARFDEAAANGEKAQEIAGLFPSDQYLYFKSLGGLGYLHWITGDFQKGTEIGELLLAYGERNANSRSKVIGHLINAQVEYHLGDIPASLSNGQKSIEASEDPTYIQFGRISAGMASLLSGDFAQAEKALKPLVDFCEKGGCHAFHPWACIFLGPALIAQGRMNQGMELFEKARQMIDEGRKKVAEPYYEYALGKTYSLMATGPKPSLAVTARNIGFLAKNVPTASKKAAHHLKRGIELSKEIGADALLGLAYLDLGLFYKSKREPNQAREYLSQAIHLFEKSQAENYLKQAKDAMDPLE
jgi:tetratricopeptide (TPR) repeat protein